MKRIIQLLVIDMEKSKKIEKLLESTSYEIRIYKNISQVFHEAADLEPTLLIIDDSIGIKTMKGVIAVFKKTLVLSEVAIFAIFNAYDEEDIETIIKQGITEIIVAPFTNDMFILRLNRLLNSFSCQNAFVDLVKVNSESMSEVQSVLISGLATIAEFRDPETGAHIKRTQNYVKALAVACVKEGVFIEELTPENIDLIYMSVPLHDIGKVGISDDILLKKGKLTFEEYEEMKKHTTLGHKAICETKDKLKNNDFLKYAELVAYTHQEKWDGSGYPRGLKRNNIPLIGRLMAIADVYDALVSKRVYKPAFTHEKAVSIILEGKGSHFDPRLVKIFIKIEAIFNNIAMTYKDTDYDVKVGNLPNIVEKGIVKNVLVLDDSKIIRSIIKNQLKSIGCKVIIGENGLVGLQIFKLRKFDVILTDLEMPIMDGYLFAKTIRKHYPNDNVIIIGITAADYELTNNRALAIGLDGFLLKPLDIVRFEKKIMQIINRKKNNEY